MKLKLKDIMAVREGIREINNCRFTSNVKFTLVKNSIAIEPIAKSLEEARVDLAERIKGIDFIDPIYKEAEQEFKSLLEKEEDIELSTIDYNDLGITEKAEGNQIAITTIQNLMPIIHS